jgi:hypothetical protein
MGGEKIELCKETLRFMIGQLTPADRLCIVTFSSGVSMGGSTWPETL